METKLFEVRDAYTCIPVVAVKLDAKSEAERFLLARSGFGVALEDQRKYVLVASLSQLQYKYSWASWSSGTMRAAHKYIQERFEKLPSGWVIDVRYLKQETESPCLSEAITGV